MDMVTNDSIVELESLDAPGWGATFWTGVGVGFGIGIVVFT